MGFIPIHKDCETAQEFIDELRIENKKWLYKRYWHSTWIFRGQEEQNDNSWELKPTAWREIPHEDENTKQNLNSTWLINATKTRFNRDEEFLPSIRVGLNEYLEENKIDVDEKTYSNYINLLIQVLSEKFLLTRFMDESDKFGYKVPLNEDNFRKITNTFLKHYLNNIGSDVNLKIWNSPSTAIAQHHGIPTRLLDWTENPLTAIFFAAENVQMLPDSDSKRIVVIALNRFGLPDDDFEYISIPRQHSTFIQSQEGIFTLYKKADDYFLKNGHYPSFEEIYFYNKTYVLDDVEYYPMGGFQKITLPHSEAGELLRLLNAMGISRAKLMPTLDNIATSIKTWQYWFNQQMP